MMRTVACRVLAASLYVGVGITGLLAQQVLTVLALAVFSFVQILWQVNSVADIRLRRRLADRSDDQAGKSSGRDSDSR